MDHAKSDRQDLSPQRVGNRVGPLRTPLHLLVEDVRLAVAGRCPVEFYGRSGGGIPKNEDILKQVKKILK